MVFPTANALVVEFSPPQKRGENLGWFISAMQLGLAMGSIFGESISNFLEQDSYFSYAV